MPVTRKQWARTRFGFALVGALAVGIHFGWLVGVAYFCSLPFVGQKVVLMKKGFPKE